MGTYMPIGCCKCDFSEGQSDKCCKKDLCNDYEQSFIFDSNCDIPNLGFDTIDEFNKAFGTNHSETM